MKKSLIVIFLLVNAMCPVAIGQKLQDGPQVLTFFSAVDDTEQPYGLYLPKNYDDKKKYPLVVMLHGAGSNHRLALRRVFGKSNLPGENDVEATRYFPEWNAIDYIVISPYARGTMGYQGIAERDVLDALADAKKRFSIDEDRVYLTGLSMGGGGTLWIGLTHPDIWAAMAPVCPAPPKNTEAYAPNALNIPMYFFHGDADGAVPVSVSRKWTNNLKALGTRVEYKEYPGVGHNSWENAYADETIFTWFNSFKRDRFPLRVRFSTLQYKYSSAYWVQLDQLTPGTLAGIDAVFTAVNKIDVAVTGLGAFTLKLADHLKFKGSEPIEININSSKPIKIQDTSGSISLSMQNGKWVVAKYEAPTLSKKMGTEGPIAAAFSDRHLYVYGTKDNPGEAELKNRSDMAAQAANWSAFRNSFLGRIMVFPRVVSDKEIRPSDFESSNLILFGTKETNSVIEKYSPLLPMHLNTTAKDFGLLYVFPVDKHYVVINSGLPWWAGITSDSRFLIPSLEKLGDFKDFILYKDAVTNEVSHGYFDSNWKLTNPDAKTLAGSGVVVMGK